MGQEECKHEFFRAQDWEGDPSAGPSYVRKIYTWRCLHCDHEQDERPPEDQIHEPDYEAYQWN